MLYVMNFAGTEFIYVNSKESNNSKTPKRRNNITTGKKPARVLPEPVAI